MNSGQFQCLAPIEGRFWDHVSPEPNTGCWLWIGYYSEGYGQISGGGRVVSAHVLSWEIHFGPVPAGLFVLHKCDVHLCVNPDHLFVGTQADNMADKARKGRAWHPVGELHPGVKLDDASIAALRSEYVPFKTSARVLAVKYGLSQSYVYEILKGRAR